MKKILYFKSEIIMMILTLAILAIFLFPVFNFEYFSYYNFFLPIRNILATIFFVLLTVFKNSKKINMIVILNRFEEKELIFSYAYYLSIFILFLLVLYLKYLGFLLVTVIISLEVILLITNYYAVYIKKITRDITKYIKLKEVTYTLMMLIIILNNFPFEIYNIPMNVIMAMVYALVQINVVYKLYN